MLSLPDADENGAQSETGDRLSPGLATVLIATLSAFSWIVLISIVVALRAVV